MVLTEVVPCRGCAVGLLRRGLGAWCQAWGVGLCNINSGDGAMMCGLRSCVGRDVRGCATRRADTVGSGAGG